MMSVTRGILTALGAAVLTACSSLPDDAVVGTWLTDSGLESVGPQGIILNRMGRAGSVNMATLEYQSYSLNGNILTLRGISHGNGQDIPFEESWTVVEAGTDTLTLRKDGFTETFHRVPDSADYE